MDTYCYICFFFILGVHFSPVGSSPSLLPCGFYNENDGSCVICSTTYSDSESFFANHGKKVPEHECQTPIETFEKEVVFDKSTQVYYLVVGLNAVFTTIQHTKQVLVQVNFNCPKAASCSGVSFLAINLPSLMPIHVSTLPLMDIYLPLESLNVINYHSLLVTSHSKDACGGHSSNYVVDVSAEDIESVYLSTYSDTLPAAYCDAQMVLRSNASFVTSSTPTLVTETITTTTGVSNKPERISAAPQISIVVWASATLIFLVSLIICALLIGRGCRRHSSAVNIANSSHNPIYDRELNCSSVDGPRSSSRPSNSHRSDPEEDANPDSSSDDVNRNDDNGDIEVNNDRAPENSTEEDAIDDHNGDPGFVVRPLRSPQHYFDLSTPHLPSGRAHNLSQRSIEEAVESTNEQSSSSPPFFD